MSYMVKLAVNDDQIDDIVRQELLFQRECCDESEMALIEALDKVISIFTPPSEIVEQETYMYGQYDLPYA